MTVAPEREAAITFTISVGHLVSQVVTSGDINLRFTRRGSAVEGIRGHQRVQRRRPGDYRAEVSLRDTVRQGEFELQINGRADGIFSSGGRVVLEEIKTVRVPVEEIPDSVRQTHWAQARIYGYLYMHQERLREITVQLCYLDLDTDEMSELQESWQSAELAGYYQGLVASYLALIERRAAWQRVRDSSIDALEFPHARYRAGQREVAVAAYRAMVNRERLMVEAPTGIGKTLGTLFPALKAMAEGRHQQLFYLTAKTSGREIAERSLRTLAEGRLRIKAVTITAREKICFNPGAPCEPEHCSYARGYYDRMRQALPELLDRFDLLDRSCVEEVASEYHLCPFELTLDLATWMDCIICDYNYVFDPAVYLRRFFDDVTGEYCFLVDEAHNLVDRGRDMYSAALDKDALLAVRRRIKDAMPEVAGALQAMNRAVLEMRRECEESFAESGNCVTYELPGKLLRAAREFCRRAEPRLAAAGPDRPDEGLLQLYFDALAFLRISEYFGAGYVTLLQGAMGGGHRALRVTLYCLDPSEHLARGFGHANASVLFSATLAPPEYYRQMLGVGRESSLLRLPSPFPQEHLGVFVARRVSTTYRNRARSFDAVVELIEAMVGAATGNYLIYFPSYRYMEEVRARFEARSPALQVVAQARGMTEPERDTFLARFVAGPQSTVVGFAVLGGVFGEGIDLAGTRLIGVMIVSVGLPQLGIEKDLIMDYFADTGAGFEFAYLYPGMTRVLQTAGRVIRSEEDRGVICLVDERYGQHRYRELMPATWRPWYFDTPVELRAEMAKFWDDSA